MKEEELREQLDAALGRSDALMIALKDLLGSAPESTRVAFAANFEAGAELWRDLSIDKAHGDSYFEAYDEMVEYLMPRLAEDTSS
jgi:hypothetical protein